MMTTTDNTLSPVPMREPLSILAYLPEQPQVSRLPRFENRCVMVTFNSADPIATSDVVTNCDAVATTSEHIALLREAARRLNRFADDAEEALIADLS